MKNSKLFLVNGVPRTRPPKEPRRVKYPLILEDRIWNYFIGWLEITRDPNHYMIVDTYNHFKARIGQDNIDNILNRAKKKILG